MKTIFSWFILSFFLFAHEICFALPARGQKIVIAAASQYAVDYGKEIARRGGNIVDVACAVGLTMAVTNPYFASLGGGGFAVFRIGKVTQAIDFREVAPKGTDANFFENKPKDSSVHGGTAVGVPGMLYGYYELHKKYGKLRWQEILKLPIQLATNGFKVTPELYKKTAEFKDKFNSYGLKHFFKEASLPYQEGEVFKQPALAQALQKIAQSGPKEFYSGSIAKDIVESVVKSGGVLSLEDFKNYRVRWLKPMQTQFMGYTIYMMPLPSSGGVVMTSALKLFEMQNLKNFQPETVDELHLMTEVFHRAYRGRVLLGDLNINQSPLKKLLAPGHLLFLSKSINLQQQVRLAPIQSENDIQLYESNETTHFSILMNNGDAMAMTITLNGPYGSGVVSEKYGIALNNEMDDFTTRPKESNIYGLIQGQANLVKPGKRPLSSMTPTLVEKNGQIVLVLGAQGGPRIISSVAQVLYRVLVNNYDIEKAIQSPRLHAQFMPNTTFVDAKGWPSEILSGLKARGHQVEESWMGRVYGVHWTKEKMLEGAHDPRVEGTSGGF